LIDFPFSVTLSPTFPSAAMAYKLPVLPYSYDALEPYIDARTMQIHHTKHHQAYVDKANAAFHGTDWAERPIEEVLKNLKKVPEDKRTAVQNNGGGHGRKGVGSLRGSLQKPSAVLSGALLT